MFCIFSVFPGNSQNFQIGRRRSCHFPFSSFRSANFMSSESSNDITKLPPLVLFDNMTYREATSRFMQYRDAAIDLGEQVAACTGQAGSEDVNIFFFQFMGLIDEMMKFTEKVRSKFDMKDTEFEDLTRNLAESTIKSLRENTRMLKEARKQRMELENQSEEVINRVRKLQKDQDFLFESYKALAGNAKAIR